MTWITMNYVESVWITLNYIDLLWITNDYNELHCNIKNYTEFLQFLRIYRNIILINICILEFICNFFINVDYPVSCFPRVASFWLFNNFLFGSFCHSYIIIFSPLFLESIIDEWKVMATVSSSLMYTDWV